MIAKFWRGLYALTCTSLFISLSAGAKYIDQGHGIVHMNGAVHLSACSIRTESLWQSVDFGHVSLRSFDGNGDGPKRTFSIYLDDCELARENGKFWQSVVVVFDGQSLGHAPELFVAQGEAQGISLSITDQQGNKAIPGLPLTSLPFTSGNNELKYHFQLVKSANEGEVGEWEAMIRFMIAYQ